MADTCYYKGTKVILLPGRNVHGKWVCQFTIPELRASAAGTYEGRSPKEYETEQEAETAAFECSKKILDSSNQETTEDEPQLCEKQKERIQWRMTEGFQQER